MTETQEFQPRTEQQLREALRTVCEVIWNGDRSKPGQHVWSIPVDKARDFDCILGDGIAELVALRNELATARADLATAEQAREALQARIEKWANKWDGLLSGADHDCKAADELRAILTDAPDGGPR